MTKPSAGAGVRAALALTALLAGAVSAGPPFRTDDPQPVDYRHIEFYTFTSGTAVEGDTSGVAPAAEFNYGAAPDLQLHMMVQFAFNDPAGGPSRFGYGDTELGFKYRFIHEDEKGLTPQVAIFPAVELPTGSERRGLGAGYTRFFLPVWVQKGLGDGWLTYGGGGRWFNRNSEHGTKDYWFFGWLLQKQVTRKLALGGEIFHQTGDSIDALPSTGFNLGAIYDLNDHDHLLFSTGRDLQHPRQNNQFSWYFGWQITY